MRQHQHRLRKRDSTYQPDAFRYRRIPGCEANPDSRNVLVATLDSETADAIAQDPAVEFVEQDYVIPLEDFETEATASLTQGDDTEVGFDLNKTNTWYATDL